MEDGRSSQAPARNKPQKVKPARPAPSGHARPAPSGHAKPLPNGHGLKNPDAKNPQSQTRAGPVKGATLNKPRPATAVPRKIDNGGNGSVRPTGHHKPLPSKVPAQTTGTSKHPAKVTKDPYLKNRTSATLLHSSAQKNHYSDQRRPSQSLNNIKSMPNKPSVSTNSQVSTHVYFVLL